MKQIACGSGHTVALTTEGEVYSWGRGDDGRLGHGDNGWSKSIFLVLVDFGTRVRGRVVGRMFKYLSFFKIHANYFRICAAHNTSLDWTSGSSGHLWLISYSCHYQRWIVILLGR